MDELAHSCDAATEYPKNLVCHHTHQHVLDSYVHKLEERGDNLFCSPNKAVVNFWQFDHEAQGMSSEKSFKFEEPNSPPGFWHRCVHNLGELYEQLHIASSPQRLDPRCRFM